MTEPKVNPIHFADDDNKEEKPAFLLQQLLKTRTVMIAKPVDRQLMERVANALTMLEADDPDAPITVFVNSPGGDADSGFAIYDLLKFCRPGVRTVCAGLAASAGVPIFLGGDKGHRYSLPNSRFLLHQPSMQMMGQASDLEITAAEILKIREKYNGIISQETGRDSDLIRRDCDRDFWLSASEAVEYGLVDRIIEHRGELD